MLTSCPWFVFLVWSWRVLVCFHGSSVETARHSHDTLPGIPHDNIERLLRARARWGHQFCFSTVLIDTHPRDALPDPRFSRAASGGCTVGDGRPAEPAGIPI